MTAVAPAKDGDAGRAVSGPGSDRPGPGLAPAIAATGAAASARGPASVRLAAATITARPVLVAVGLLGFLARGGLVAFLLPIVALPTPTGISNFLGGTALTGAGASDSLIRMIVVGVVLVFLVVAVGAVLGAISDVLLTREAMSAASVRGDARVPAISGDLVTRLLVIRVLALIPVAVAVAWAATRLVAAGYHQLILPDDVQLPLAVRILMEALDAAVVVVVVWLAAELVGGIAVREAILGARSAPAAFIAAVLALGRRPGRMLASFGLGVVGVTVACGPALILAAALWSRLQSLLADDVAVPLLAPATFIFVAVWAFGLLAVGIVAAWRSILGGLDVLSARAPNRAVRPGTGSGEAG